MRLGHSIVHPEIHESNGGSDDKRVLRVQPRERVRRKKHRIEVARGLWRANLADDGSASQDGFLLLEATAERDIPKFKNPSMVPAIQNSRLESIIRSNSKCSTHHF